MSTTQRWNIKYHFHNSYHELQGSIGTAPNCHKTNSYIRLRNMGAERNYNSEIAGLLEENFKKNIWAYERKSNMED